MAKRRRQSKGKKITITVGTKLGKPNPPKTTIAQGLDAVFLKNKFSGAVLWKVEEGVFYGGAVEDTIEKDKTSDAKTVIPVNQTKAVVYKVTPRDRQGRRKKRRILNDPVIIIDP